MKIPQLLMAGTKYSLTVLAQVNGTVNGEARTIDAYTTPQTVDGLTLTSTEQSIYATWNHPNGSFFRFSVTLYLNSLATSINNDSTTDLYYNFTNLRSTTLYKVSVITHVEIDEHPSKAADAFIYTRPERPAIISAVALSDSTIQLKWKAPKDADVAQSMVYNVTYISYFWGDSKIWNETVTNQSVNTKNISGLNSGTKYNFRVSVYAGDLTSLPDSTDCKTDPIYKNLTLMMQCSSATSLYCKQSSTKTLFHKELEKKMKSKFGDQDIVWSVHMKEGK
ncbi:receptor-type tyrosine-protein phosphatase eta [Colossoma macropomum]|uniref:receptor-type tyrosine-protein phosphatase eta n=1 Tax=Colossoma macropomum TaxID=42526 RepID=UPI001865194A|nr:receptor-type tyrosine-protein phosphatase eta [Colossoma macropomum]